MPCAIGDLERGAVCLSLFPFTTGFPLEAVVRTAEGEFADLEQYESVDEIDKTIKPEGDPPEIVTRVKLRRVVILHDGTHKGIQDVAVARINSVSESKKAKEKWYRRLAEARHPTHYLIGGEARHGTNGVEAYVDTTSVMQIQKSTVLRRVGTLNDDEMREISERIVTALELDLSRYVEELARSEEDDDAL